MVEKGEVYYVSGKRESDIPPEAEINKNNPPEKNRTLRGDRNIRGSIGVH